ncbi:MAG: hypothetical protein IJ416_09910 [Ruminiclostridium sp.]|nr:hypothetical protein [Ruminiclostridium sp.]
MEISLNAETLSKPWCRALIGIILIAAGIICFTFQNRYSGITRENCTAVETSFSELRTDLATEKSTYRIWLLFEDYDNSLDIHPSCVTDELTSTLIGLEKGAKMKILHSNKTSDIYELWANGELLLDFDTAKAKIEENITFLKYFGYVLLPLGAVSFISSFIKKGKNKDNCSGNN